MSETAARSPARARIAAWWQKIRAEPKSWSIRAATAACLVVGFWLRARGFFYDVPAMGLDECSWGMMLMDLPLRELLIRPPGFMAVSKVSAWLFGPTEAALRTLPWLAGIASLGLAPFLANRLFDTAAPRLLFVAIIAMQPAITDLTKEFKPYSLSVALHMALVYLALRYVTEQRRRDLVWLLSVAAVGILFTQDLVFAYPGVFALVGWNAFKNHRRHLPAVVGAALLIVAALLLQYFLIWKNLPKDEAAYWGNKYNVFYVPTSRASYFEWLFGRYRRFAALPSQQRTYWDVEWLDGNDWVSFVELATDIWLVLHVLGLLVLLLRRRYRDLVLLVLPLLVLVVFNRLGFWPFGAFRTNSFLIPYLAGVAAAALDGRFRKNRPFWDLVPASALVVIPLFFFEKNWPPPTKRTFTRTSEYPELLTWLASQDPKPPSLPRQVVVLSHATCEPWDFFLKYHPRTKSLRSAIEERYEARCIEDADAVLGELRSAVASTSRSAWLVRGRNPPFGRQSYLARGDSQRFDRHYLVEWDERKPRDERKPKKKRGSKRRAR